MMQLPAQRRLTLPRTRTWNAGLLLLFGDLVSLLLAASLGFSLRKALGGYFPLEIYLKLLPGLLLFPLFYAALGLYPGFGLTPPEELRRLSQGTTLVYLLLGASSLLFKGGEAYSRGVFFLAWGCSLLLTPLFRALLRELFAAKSWWGEPVVILGQGAVASELALKLREQPGLGLKPIAQLDPRDEQLESPKARWAILAMPELPREELLKLLEEQSQRFPHLILIPDLLGLASLWIIPRDLKGILGLELRQELLLEGPRRLKRALDLLLTLLVALPATLVGLIIATLIRLDSPGPIFYSQERIGLGGKKFRLLKFRSMVDHAEAALAACLQDPLLRAEWEAKQKFTHDPRITRMGRWLRRWSLDELPQLWNVLKGEMSLVGPRPIQQDEIARYGGSYPLYTKVRPGLVGLWQVSGRSQMSYEERVQLDSTYVRNWSIWLDLWILARGVWAVLRREGAY